MIEASARVAERLGEFVARFDYADIPEAVVEKAKDHVAYLLASSFTGHSMRKGREARRAMRQLGGGGGRATVVGEQDGLPAIDAAYANSLMMAAPGLDDVLLPAGVHPGQVILPVALALAEQEGRSGRDVLTAMVAGYEVIGKLGVLQWMWVAPTPQRGTIPFGAFGSAAAAAKMLGLTAEQAGHAMGLAANAGMGLSENPFLQALYGFAARNGLTAAVLAAAGSEAPPSTFTGRSGFFQVFFGQIPENLDGTLNGLGIDLEMSRAQIKPYPTTGMNITVIELARELARADRIGAADVASIRIGVSALRANHKIGHAIGPFASADFAQSSAPFNVALALVDGRIHPARYEDYEDVALIGLTQKTQVILEDHENLRRAWIEIVTTDGRRHRIESDAYEVRIPGRREVLERDGLALLGPERVAAIEAAIGRLPEIEDITELTRNLRSKGGTTDGRAG